MVMSLRKDVFRKLSLFSIRKGRKDGRGEGGRDGIVGDRRDSIPCRRRSCVVASGGGGCGSDGGRVAGSHLGVRCKQTLTNGRLTGTSLKYLPQS